jgi:hypothetical protein
MMKILAPTGCALEKNVSFTLWKVLTDAAAATGEVKKISLLTLQLVQWKKCTVDADFLDRFGMASR